MDATYFEPKYNPKTVPISLDLCKKYEGQSFSLGKMWMDPMMGKWWSVGGKWWGFWVFDFISFNMTYETKNVPMNITGTEEISICQR